MISRTMAFFRKILHKYNSSNYIRYGVYALLLFYFFSLLRMWWIRNNMSYGGTLSSFRLFSYKSAKLSGQKYILTWDNYFLMSKRNKQIFPNLQCPVNNCIFTKDRNLLLGGYTRFDAIIFSDKCFKRRRAPRLPQKRLKSQIYIYSTVESSYNIPACDVNKDDFFNWTFTYRLDSDVIWPYFYVRNVSRHIVAPSKHVQWEEYDNRAIPLVIQNHFRHRTKAAAWLVSHCNAASSRDDYLTRLQEHLYHFSLQIDVFGGCTKIRCTNNNCAVMFRKNYYFYMAFENSFSEDYVTEKVLHGYNNYVVPIVYGGANYSRFLPPGSYLNAHKLHPYNLAYIMYQSIKDPAKYQEFFKWTNHYTIDEVRTLKVIHPLCNLCEALHSNRIRHQQRYKNFRLWWNGPKGFKWCLSAAYWNETGFLQVENSQLMNMY